ncbi:Ribosomal large subunit pseudouridine synthase B [Minicystis rosea]|nr:Ribosomal large subunit pseudouridine synthase B [Minicystis rosea]
MQERLQKIIARAGVTSRRAGEELIQNGRVRVNGRIVTELGAKADPRSDTIEVDGRRLVAEAARYIVLHKPRNVVSTLSDPEGRPTVAELLAAAGSRLYPVGRLDFATSGVLLATNDGDFANGLLHPRGGVPKTYVLKVKGQMGEEDFERWARGVDLEDGRTLPAEVRLIRHEDDKTWFEITIREGRNQQIRRMGEATGFPVMRLARVSFAGISHEGLRPGDFRSLTVDELEALRKTYGVPKRIRGAALGDHVEASSHRARRGPRSAAASARDEGERRRPHGREDARGERRESTESGEAFGGGRRFGGGGERGRAERGQETRAERGRARAPRAAESVVDRGRATRSEETSAERGHAGGRSRSAGREEAQAGRGRAPARGERGRSFAREDAGGERGRAPARGERGRSFAREDAHGERGHAPARADRGRPPARADRSVERGGASGERGRSAARADRGRSTSREQPRGERRSTEGREDRRRSSGREGASERPAREAPKGAGDRRPRRREG